MKHYVGSDLQVLGRAGAVEAMRGYLRAAGGDRVAAPPRMQVPVLGRALVFTIGGSADGDVAGFRMYSKDPERDTHADSQLLALLRLSDGKLLATAVGAEFGAWRTAALGAVAMDEATRHIEAGLSVGVLGAGFQAYHHARTWAATRPIAAFRVWARRAEAGAKFAHDLTCDTQVDAKVSATAEDAVRGAHAVLGATRSPRPIVQATAFEDGGYVATVGPKFGGRHELPAGVYAGAEVLLSDAVAQCARFEAESGPLPGGRRAADMVALADVVAGNTALPSHARTLFVSEGLAGSEVALLAALHALR